MCIYGERKEREREREHTRKHGADIVALATPSQLFQFPLIPFFCCLLSSLSLSILCVPPLSPFIHDLEILPFDEVAHLWLARKDCGDELSRYLLFLLLFGEMGERERENEIYIYIYIYIYIFMCLYVCVCEKREKKKESEKMKERKERERERRERERERKKESK